MVLKQHVLLSECLLTVFITTNNNLQNRSKSKIENEAQTIAHAIIGYCLTSAVSAGWGWGHQTLHPFMVNLHCIMVLRLYPPPLKTHRPPPPPHTHTLCTG